MLAFHAFDILRDYLILIGWAWEVSGILKSINLFFKMKNSGFDELAESTARSIISM
jgi:hypothetical protein